MESLTHLSEAQRLVLNKSTALIGINQNDQIIAQNPQVLHTRLEDFMRYETTLVGQFHDPVASAIPTRSFSVFEVEQRIDRSF